MNINIPRLFGIKHSNRDFNKSAAWGKNLFCSSFPASLAAYLESNGLENIYLTLDSNLRVCHKYISTTDVFGIDTASDDLFYSFESTYHPFEQLIVGKLPRVDLVTQRRSNTQVLKPIEIKLTALPDNSTCELSEDKYGSEMVVRPDTIAYLACSIAFNFREKSQELQAFFSNDFATINDWTIGDIVWPHLTKMIDTIDKIILSILCKQEPILMQPIWRTKGKSLVLAENCLDVFVWSNFAFTQLFLTVARREISTNNKINRQIRTIIWLFKMLYDYSLNGQFDHANIIDGLSYNTKNDKAFAVNGKVTHPYMDCDELHCPRIKKEEIKNIILGGGQNLLSPERRFDAIIYNSPDIF